MTMHPAVRSCVLSSTALALALSACGRGPSEASVSHPKLDVSLPSAPDGDRIASFVTLLRGIQAQGSGQLTPDQVFGFFPLSGDERALVAGARTQPVDVSCDGDTCTAVSHGDEVRTTLSQVDIPTLGHPTIWMGQDVTVVVRILGDRAFEMCRVENIEVQKLFWVDFDGGYVNADGGSFIDVGPGGTYPSC